MEKVILGNINDKGHFSEDDKMTLETFASFVGSGWFDEGLIYFYDKDGNYWDGELEIPYKFKSDDDDDNFPIEADWINQQKANGVVGTIYLGK